MSALATCLGHPRIGASRELKRALESYWSKKSSEASLQETAAMLRRRHLGVMKEAGLDHIPSNDFSLYDHMLDTALLVGAINPRFQEINTPNSLSLYFAMARGGCSTLAPRDRARHPIAALATAA